MTAKAGVAGPATEWSTSTGFFDFDRDGDLDLYVTNYLDYRLTDNPYCGERKAGYRMYCHPTMFDGMADRLYRNNGNGTFTDVSRRGRDRQSGRQGPGRGVLRLRPRRRHGHLRRERHGAELSLSQQRQRHLHRRGLWRRRRVRRQRQAAGRHGHRLRATVDGNGLPDIFVTNFSEELNTLYGTAATGCSKTSRSRPAWAPGFIPLGFGTKLFDFDNDGDLDIHVTNGHVIDNVKLYQPDAHATRRRICSTKTSAAASRTCRRRSAALQAERVGRGLAVADFDNDGRLDVVISSLGRPRSPTAETGRAGRQLDHDPGAGEQEQSLRAGRDRARRDRRRGSGAGDQQRRELSERNDIRLHVGVGTAQVIQRIEVLWPSGAKQTLKDVAVNQILTIKEP